MINSSYVSESIQLAVAPVFLLTAVAGMIGALTQRLSRVIDRSRALQYELTNEVAKNLSPKVKASHQEELVNIAKRGKCINISMVLLVLCAIQIGITVLELFFGETTEGKFQISNYVFLTFVGGIGSFILALIALLWEVLIASYSIRWQPHSIEDNPN
jgi:hypothetical protein